MKPLASPTEDGAWAAAVQLWWGSVLENCVPSHSHFFLSILRACDTQPCEGKPGPPERKQAQPCPGGCVSLGLTQSSIPSYTKQRAADRPPYLLSVAPQGRQQRDVSSFHTPSNTHTHMRILTCTHTHVCTLTHTGIQTHTHKYIHPACELQSKTDSLQKTLREHAHSAPFPRRNYCGMEKQSCLVGKTPGSAVSQGLCIPSPTATLKAIHVTPRNLGVPI